MVGRRKNFTASIVVGVTMVASAVLASGLFSPLLSRAASAPAVTDFAVPGGADPWGTAIDSQGRVWVALPGCDPSPQCPAGTAAGKIAVFDPGTKTWVKTIQLPSDYGQPLFLAFDKSGAVWFPMPMSNALGKYDLSQNTFNRWTVPTANAGPWAVAVDKNGIVWLTEHYTNRIATFNPTTQTFKEIATPDANSQPYGITVDGNNNVWFTQNVDSVASIDEYTPSGTLKVYKVRSSSTTGTGLTPHLLTVDANGNIWWSEGWVTMAGMLNVAQAVPGTSNGVTEYNYTGSGHTSGISAGPDGRVWITDSLQNVFGYIPVSGGTFTFFRAPGDHPHDGLNVDGQNRVWFNEEFANKLVLAIPSSPVAMPTATVTATTTTTSSTILGQDTFRRADQSFWGTASDGQAWGGDANMMSNFSVVGNTGRFTGSSASYSAVLGVAATNAEVVMSGSISNFTGNNLGSVLRWSDGNNWYKAYIDGNSLVIQKKVNGTTTVLKAVPFTATAGTSYTLHFRVSGSTLSANAWPSSGTEPAGWLATATDTALTSGQCGLRLLSQHNAITTITSFVAKTL